MNVLFSVNVLTIDAQQSHSLYNFAGIQSNTIVPWKVHGSPTGVL